MLDNYPKPTGNFCHPLSQGSCQAAQTALSLLLNWLWPTLCRCNVCSALPTVSPDIPHLSSGQQWRLVKRLLHPGTRSLTSGHWAGSWTVHKGLHSHLWKLQLYLYRLNPKWWSRLKIDPLLLKAELLLWDNKCAHTGGSWFFLSSKGFVWSITITLIHIYLSSSCESKWYALLGQKLFHCWQIENDATEVSIT